MAEYIEKQEVMKVLPFGLGYTMHNLIREIDKIPTADVEPIIHAKWTKLSNTVPCFNCPICGSTFTLLLGADKMKSCPNCRAKMDKE